MLTQLETQIIINTLSNIYDWESENLEEDFCNFICKEIKTIDHNLAKKLFIEFDQLSPLERDSIYFDYNDFLKETINHYIS